jgi:hypothetical protein
MNTLNLSPISLRNFNMPQFRLFDIFASLAILSFCGLGSSQPLSIPSGSPDYSNDTFPPYPPLTDPTVQNFRGTRLFGWNGCGASEVSIITEAYNDMYKISNLPSNYQNIDWQSSAAKEFFGPRSGQYKLTDDVKTQITSKRYLICHSFQVVELTSAGEDIMVQVQQMYYTWLTPRGYGALWIRVSAPKAANSLWFHRQFTGF